MHRQRVRFAGLLTLACLTALAAPAAAGSPKETFEAFLLGPWGKSTTSGEPVSDIILGQGGTRFTRKACPPEGLPGPAGMLSIETWFARGGDGVFGRYTDRSPTTLSPLTFRRTEGPHVAYFEYNTFLAGNVTMKVERLGKDRIKTTVAIPGTVVETYYIRCRQR